MAQMILNEQIITLDDEDMQLISYFNWYISSGGYAITTVNPPVGWPIKSGKTIADYAKTVSMHRLVLHCPKQEVDHINRNRLDNRKENLRLCTHTENMQNISPYTRTVERFLPKGVSRNRNKYQVVIRVAGKLTHFGTFDKLEDAASKAERELVLLGKSTV